MDLHIKRTTFTDNSTIGELTVDGKWYCYTLEDMMREKDGATFPACKVQNETAIPRGTYKVIIDYSQHFTRELPHVLGVPCYEGVRIHPGNSSKDTDGCVLLGMTQSPDWVGQSQIAFNGLFEMMEAAYNKHEEITLTVE